jgi:tetratricopeptide (TPR) repeat protein
MAFRFQRRVKLASGLRLNVSKRGLGLSVGVPGARASVNTRGQRTTSFGVPGTGMSWRTTREVGARAKAQPKGRGQARPVLNPRAGEIVAAVSQRDTARLQTLAGNDAELAPTLWAAAGLLLAVDDPWRAEALLFRVWGRGGGLEQAGLARAGLGGLSFSVAIAPGVSVDLPPTRQTAGLALVELLQARDAMHDALDIAEALDASAPALLSLAELYTELGRWEQVLEVTQEVRNTDDCTALVLILRGIAFQQLGRIPEALDCFGRVVRTSSRSLAIRSRARLERARSHLATGRRADARRELVRLLADDPHVPAARHLLATIQR